MKPFLIFGLPRSRTAWFANFLTTGPTFCHHDATSLCRDDRDLKSLFMPSRRFVGNSDTGQVILYDRIAGLLPEPPKLIFIRRDPVECAESCARANLPIVLSDLQFLDREMQKLAARCHKDSAVFDFDTLNEAHCRAIWEIATWNELPFDVDRFRLLSDLNIQMHPAIMSAELPRRADNMRALLA